jgi:cell division protein FtsW (lipid II flippase)
MLGVMPLTGLPLLFISHGGSALLFALAEIGIVLNISKFRKI